MQMKRRSEKVSDVNSNLHDLLAQRSREMKQKQAVSSQCLECSSCSRAAVQSHAATMQARQHHREETYNKEKLRQVEAEQRAQLQAEKERLESKQVSVTAL